MKERKLVLYSIMKFNDAYVEEICQDIIEQYNTGVCSLPMFNMTLVPEGDPLVDKAEELCNSYKKYKAILDKAGVPSGVLVQATLGHGWTLGKPFAIQAYTNLTDGKTDNVACPLDDRFNEYIYNAIKKIALCSPKAIMIDDDFRLVTRPGKACACPLHMKKFNEMAGLNLTREELWEKIQKGDEEGNRLYDILKQTNQDSLLATAQIIRKAIDEVDPYIQGSYCGGSSVSLDYERAVVLSGSKNPVTYRLSNGYYTPAGTRFFSYVSFRAARHTTRLKDKVDVIMAETDTCPHNRYSTSAQSLHTHFICSLLEGCNGAKQWLTRSPYEPNSGKAYRKVLAKNRDLYEELARIYPTLRWRGFNTFITRKLTNYTNVEHNDGFTTTFLDQMGLPLSFSTEVTGINCFAGKITSILPDEEVKELLAGNVVLDWESAKILIDRGYGKYLGVDIREWTGKMPKTEVVYNEPGKYTSIQQSVKEIVITDDKVEAVTKVYNQTTGCEPEYLFPGSTKFKNELGGTVYVFAGTPTAPRNIHGGAFSFLNETRKRQFIDILKEHGEAQVYYPGDAEVYLKTANMDDGGYFVSFINECADPIENIELIVDKKVKKIYKLNEKGERVKVKFTQKGDLVTLKEPSFVLQPVLLLIY
ncbi:MAG: hypothetical protein IKJ14_05980 [Clostridia bacterium]|nr:hypothetical protein [Clostridia bacterium]